MRPLIYSKMGPYCLRIKWSIPSKSISFS